MDILNDILYYVKHLPMGVKASIWVFGIPAAIAIIVGILHTLFNHERREQRRRKRFVKKENKYYSSETFLKIKQEVLSFVDECNELNSYIDTIKTKYKPKTRRSNKQINNIQLNTGAWNYQRQKLAETVNDASHSTVLFYDCSLSVLKNAREHPFDYLCKYFNIIPNNETLTFYEGMLNDFASIQQGTEILCQQRDEIIQAHRESIPKKLFRYGYKRFENELSMINIDIDSDYMPQYVFRYISAGGNSGQQVPIILDIDTLTDFIQYLGDKIQRKASAKWQRQLMTKQLREYIKERDNFTCKYCGVSTYQEPHLLLEIDHIVPLSKGGLTKEDNLQTLCWKCNRSKGARVQSNG